MKRIVLLALMTFSTIAAVGQLRIYYYASLEECGNDPLRYIERNYEDFSPVYQGITMAEFVDMCELELKEFVPMIQLKGWGGGVSEYMVDKVIGIWFEFDYDGYRYSVPVWFYPDYYPYTMYDFYNLENSEYDEEWKDIYYEFFKDYKIHYIGTVLKKKDGKYIENYHRPY